MTIGTTALRHPVGVSLELTEELRRRVVAETAIRVVPADGFVCHEGNSDDHWLGVLDGVVEIASVPLEGKSMSFVGVPTAGWFG